MTCRDPRRKPATLLAAGVVWIAAICAGAGLSSGCATKPATAQEELAVWLSEAPRTVAVKVAPTLPPPIVSGARVAVWRAAQLRLLGEPEEAL